MIRLLPLLLVGCTGIGATIANQDRAITRVDITTDVRQRAALYECIRFPNGERWISVHMGDIAAKRGANLSRSWVNAQLSNEIRTAQKFCVADNNK